MISQTGIRIEMAFFNMVPLNITEPKIDKCQSFMEIISY